MIDLHHHFFGKRMIKEIERMITDRTGEKVSFVDFYKSDSGIAMDEADERVSIMDEYGLEKAVLSFPSPRLKLEERHLKKPDVALELARIVNSFLCEIREEHPDRFMAFARIPLVDIDDAIQELDRAINDLRLQGIILDSNIHDQHLIEEKFAPFFDRANDMKLPIFIHPTIPAGKERMKMFYSQTIVGYPLETTLTAAYMIFSGFLEKYDALEIILSHNGGALPFIKRRFEFMYSKEDPEFNEYILHPLSKEPVDYLKDFWYDTAQSFTGAIQLALDEIGPRLVFGTDYPYGVSPEVTLTDSIKQVERLPEQDREKIGKANAEEILLL